jgi:hypothetical protein
MAKKRKKAQEVDRTLQIKLQNIAEQLGTNVTQLIEEHGDPETVIEKYNNGELQLLND